MTDQERAAMQQALECLRGVARGKYDGNAAGVCAALEVALAQQVEPVEQTKRACCTYPDCRCPIDKSTVCAKGLPEQAEPVDTDCHTQGICQRSGYGITQQAEPAASRLRAAAQAVLDRWDSPTWEWVKQSPTADLMTALRSALAQQAEPVEPVYTAPPKRKPLTDEDIRDLWSWSMTAEAERTAPTQQHAFARAVERAHGIGRQSDPQIEDRLARHGINPCPDCRGLGYDASGQLCWCQQNPSF